MYKVIHAPTNTEVATCTTVPEIFAWIGDKPRGDYIVREYSFVREFKLATPNGE